MVISSPACGEFNGEDSLQLEASDSLHSITMEAPDAAVTSKTSEVPLVFVLSFRAGTASENFDE